MQAKLTVIDMNKTTTEKKTIREARHLHITGAKINGLEVQPRKARLGNLVSDNGKFVLDLNEFNYGLTLPDEALGSDKITVELIVESVPGPR